MLPVELYGLIAEQVEVQPDLVSLLQASRTTLAEVERVLYRSIRLTKYRPASFNQLLNVLLSNPRRASLVHHLRLHFAYGFGPEKDSVELLSSVLRRLVNLVRLELKSISLDLVDLASSCTFRLQRFGYYVDKITDPSLPIFLRSQPHLLHVSLPNYIGEMDVQQCSGNLQRLTTLECSGHLANKLLPGRSVERLSLWNWDSLPIYAGCYPSLRALKLQMGLDSLNWAMFCPNLRFLALFINPKDSARNFFPSVPGLLSDITLIYNSSCER